MKKITLLMLMLGFTSLISAQCLEPEFGQWPTGTISATTCDGVAVNVATTVGYASEFSKINVLSGGTYVFSSSVATDYITISNEAGTEAYIFGEGSVEWTSTVNGVIRFYTHLSSTCDGIDENRTRSFTCTPPTCIAPDNLVLDTLTLDSVGIVWEESVSAPANGYDYFFSEGSIALVDVTDPTATLPAGTTSIAFDQLTGGTAYTFYVRSNCGGGDVSAWAGGVFNTLSANDTCETALDLGSLTSPISGTTVGAADDSSPACQTNTAPDLYYSILVPNGSTLKINQTTNDYDSKNYVFYGDCDNQTTINCFDDPDFTVTTWANDTGSDQTVYWVQDGYLSNSGAFTLAWEVIPCINATATYAVVSDCANGEQFNVNVTVSSLGSATTVSVTDDQGSAPQTVDAAGEVVTFGPYPNNTPVIFTVANPDNAACTITSPVQNQLVCPPSNDTCATATDLGTLTSPITGTTVGAIDNSSPACQTNTAPDVYYSILVPSGSTLTINQTVNSYDSKNYVFYGDCDNQTAINCFDDDDYTVTTWSNDTGSDQTVYWVQDGYLSNSGTFTLAWQVKACTNATATYSVISDCANGEQFNVAVTVTSLGSATSVSVTDDQGSAPQTVDAEGGVVTFGPYPNNTPVVFTSTNDQDGDCVTVSPAQNQIACPPSNDTCAGAIDLGALTSPLSSTTIGATDDSSPSCQTNTAPDTYYSILVPSGSTLTINQTVNNYDSKNHVFYGDCDNRTTINCFDDDDYTVTTWGNDTGSDQTVYWVQDGYLSNSGTFTLAWQVKACTNATATYSVISDCANGEQFNVAVTVTSLGSATSVSVTDDQGSAAQTVDAEGGVVTFGPYPNNTPVIFTTTNDQDGDCTTVSPTQNQTACPPSNDSLCAAVEIAVGDETPGNAYTLAGATAQAGETAGGCFNGGVNGSVWFSFVAPAAGLVTVTTDFTGGTLTDTEIAVYLAGPNFNCEDVSSLGTPVGCDQDGGVIVPNNSKITFSGATALTPDATYYVQVDRWGSATAGTFGLRIINNNLSTGDLDVNKFSFYPNPVKDVLHLSYAQNISSVAVFNLIGQQVLNTKVNANQGKIDMSALSAGTYLVKISADNQVKTIKIVKE